MKKLIYVLALALALADENSPVFLPGAFQCALAAVKAEEKLTERFKTGQGMGHISMSGDHGAIESLAGLDIGRKVFLHINNSNPALLHGSDCINKDPVGSKCAERAIPQWIWKLLA